MEPNNNKKMNVFIDWLKTVKKIYFYYFLQQQQQQLKALNDTFFEKIFVHS